MISAELKVVGGKHSGQVIPLNRKKFLIDPMKSRLIIQVDCGNSDRQFFRKVFASGGHDWILTAE